MPGPYDQEMPLTGWIEMLRGIYFPTQNYGRTHFELFGRIVKAFAGYERYMFRDPTPDRAKRHLAKMFGWSCALATRLSIPAENALWAKYPGVCPRCLERSCTCGAVPKAIDVE